MGQASRQNEACVILGGTSMKKRPVLGRALLKPVKPTWKPNLDTLSILQGQQMSIPPPKGEPLTLRPPTVKTLEDGSENGLETPPSLNREISSLRGEQTKTNPYLSFIQTAPRVEKTFAVKESLQRTAKLTNDRAINQRRQRKAYSSPLYDAETRRNKTVRFQASHSAVPNTEKIKVPTPTFQEVEESDEEEEEEEAVEEEDEGDGQQMHIVEAEEDEVSVVFEYGTYDLIDPIEEETENISPTVIPTSITPQYNAALTKLREQNTLPEAELVTATESLAEKKAKAKRVVKPPAPKPKVKPAAPPPKPPPPQQPPAPPPPKAPVKPPPQKAPPKMVPKPAPKPKAKPAPPPPKPKPQPPPPQPSTPKVQKPPKVKEKAAPPKPVSVKKVKPIIIRTATPEEEVKVAEFLPISGPEDHLSEPESLEETPPEDIKRSRSPIKKKERVERKALTPEPEPTAPVGLSPPPFVHNKRGSIIWSEDEEEEDNDDDNDQVSVNSDHSNISVSALPPDLPTLDLEQQHSRKKRIKHALQIDLNASLNKRGPKKIDPAFEEEQRRLALAEQRRQRQQQLYNKLKNRPRQITRMESDTSSEGRASFDDYDFLAKHCIFHQGSLEMYRQAFNAVDDEERGWLNEEETAIALRGVNNKLTGAEEEFLFRIMELTGYNASEGADFKLFSVLGALSHRISALDSWMKLMISETNFKLVEMKTFLCKNLWEICVDPVSKKITLDQLIVELRSGGISRKHEEDVKEKLGHFSSMDLLDFLTYSPLFIMIHQSVIDNPLSDSRDK